MKHGHLVEGRSATRGWEPATQRARRPSTGMWARLRYRFDSQLSRGAWVVIAWLGMAALALVALAALVVAVFHQGIDTGKSVGIGEAFWQDVLRLLDSGTMAGDNGWLGWSPRIFAVLAELVEANANHRDQVVVILSGEDKMVMEDRLRTVLPSFGTTRAVCRTGDPSSAHDLGLVNVSGARSVIVLAEGVVGTPPPSRRCWR